MRISTKGRYAIKLMLDLATNDNGEPIRLKDVARRQEISEKYLEQIISVLNKAGYVKSVRGPQGGYLLQRRPEEYTVGMILRLTEPRRSRMCTSVTAKPSRSRSRARTPASFVVFPALFSQSAFASMARSVRIPIFPTSSPCDLTLSLLRGEIFLQKSRKKD